MREKIAFNEKKRMFTKGVFDLAYTYFKNERKTSQIFTNEIGISLPSLKKYTEEPIREGRLAGDRNATPQAIDPRKVIHNLLSVTQVPQVKDPVRKEDAIEDLLALSKEVVDLKQKISALEQELEKLRSEVHGKFAENRHAPLSRMEAL